MLGRTTLNTTKTSSPILKSIKNTIQKDVNEVISDVAKTLDIHDFYSAHILDYCEVRPMLFCLALNQKNCIESIITTGIFYSVALRKSNLPAHQKYNVLLQSNFLFPL